MDECSEKFIERYLVSRIEAAGGLALKFTSEISTGYPDRIIILPGGRHVWVEVKSTGQKLRALQQVRAKRLQALGCTVYIAQSINDVDNIIEHELHTT